MGDKSNIAWTESTWSPVTGCQRVSPGCGGPGDAGGCYAEALAATRLKNHPRYQGVAEMKNGKPRWTGLVRTHPDFLDQPLRWKRPRRIFVCSQSDLFHEDVPDGFIAAVFGVMAACTQHTFQVLTKRANRMRNWFRWLDRDDEAWTRCIWYSSDAMGRPGQDPIGAPDLPKPWPLPNVWIGTSVEDQLRADERLLYLVTCPATVRFVSYEPALGPVDFGPWLKKLSQIIVGGESGHAYRPMDIGWLASVVDQCKKAGVAAFVKQDSGPRAGMQGRIPDDLWAVKEYPNHVHG